MGSLTEKNSDGPTIQWWAERAFYKNYQVSVKKLLDYPSYENLWYAISTYDNFVYKI